MAAKLTTTFLQFARPVAALASQRVSTGNTSLNYSGGEAGDRGWRNNSFDPSRHSRQPQGNGLDECYRGIGGGIKSIFQVLLRFPFPEQKKQKRKELPQQLIPLFRPTRETNQISAISNQNPINSTRHLIAPRQVNEQATPLPPCTVEWRTNRTDSFTTEYRLAAGQRGASVDCCCGTPTTNRPVTQHTLPLHLLAATRPEDGCLVEAVL